MARKGGRRKEMPRYTGSRSYRLFLYPEQIIFFVFQRAARLAEALIVTALLSYGSGKLRAVKAFLRQAASRNPSRRVASYGYLGHAAKRNNKTDRMLIFLRLTTSRFISLFLPLSSSCISYPDTVFHLWILGFSIRDGLHSQRARSSCVKKIYAFPSEFNSREK